MIDRQQIQFVIKIHGLLKCNNVSLIVFNSKVINNYVNTLYLKYFYEIKKSLLSNYY